MGGDCWAGGIGCQFRQLAKLWGSIFFVVSDEDEDDSDNDEAALSQE